MLIPALRAGALAIHSVRITQTTYHEKLVLNTLSMAAVGKHCDDEPESDEMSGFARRVQTPLGVRLFGEDAL